MPHKKFVDQPEILGQILQPFHTSFSENSLKKTQKLISLKFAENCGLFDTKIARNTFSSLSFEGNKIFSCSFHHWRLLKMYYHLNICFIMLAQILKIRPRDASDLKNSFFRFFAFNSRQNYNIAPLDKRQEILEP